MDRRQGPGWFSVCTLVTGDAVLSVLVLPASVPLAQAQVPYGRLALEVHAGYGGGGFHADELVGVGITYRFATHLEGTGFVTAVVARSTGRAVFAAPALRLVLMHGPVRPYPRP